jgi:hypothetical protein
LILGHPAATQPTRNDEIMLYGPPTGGDVLADQRLADGAMT